MDGHHETSITRRGLTYPLGEATPGTSETIEISPGVHWVRMPLPFSLKFINLWLIDDGESWTIVDTGMPLPDTQAAWRTIFDEKLDGRPVSRVIVTHMHPDHVGNAGWLTRKFPGADLWMTRLEYIPCRMLISDTGRDAPDAGTKFYRAAGWDDPQIEGYRKNFGRFGRGVSRMPDAYIRIEDGDTFDIGGETWEVIVGSGHSPEHACLYCEARNLLIAGDQLLPRISSNVSVFPTEPRGNPLADWLESCAKLRGRLPDDVLVLPAHNEPFRGAHTRLTHLIDGHHTSLNRLREKLAEPKRVIDTFTTLFARKIDDETLSMATGEAIAHLNHLIAEGTVARHTAEDGTDWYQALS